MKVKIEKGTMFIEIPVQSPTLSKSGKTLIVASTQGNKETPVQVEHEGKTRKLFLGLNAYIHATDKGVKPGKGE